MNIPRLRAIATAFALATLLTSLFAPRSEGRQTPQPKRYERTGDEGRITGVINFGGEAQPRSLFRWIKTPPARA